MPSVHPIEAHTLAARPWLSPVAMVKMTPVPGMRTTTREVIRNSIDIMGGVWSGEVLDPDQAVESGMVEPLLGRQSVMDWIP